MGKETRKNHDEWVSTVDNQLRPPGDLRDGVGHAPMTGEEAQ